MNTKKTASFKSAQPNPNLSEITDIDLSELVEKLEQVHLIDVRRTEEFTDELGHIPGARLMVLNTLPLHLDEIPKDETVVFMCRAGGRSAQAAAYALQNGFTRVFNAQGGMLKWNALGLPVEGESK